MAIALDKNTAGGTAKSYSADAGSGTKRCMIVCVMASALNTDDVSAVAWNGESLSLIKKACRGTANDKYIYLFAGYPVGTGAHNTVITAGEATVAQSATLVYTDVAQVGMPKNSTYAVGNLTSGNPEYTLSITADNGDWLVGMMTEYGASNASAGTNTTVRNDGTTSLIVDSNGVASPTTLGFTTDNNTGTYAFIGCAMGRSVAYSVDCAVGGFTLTGVSALLGWGHGVAISVLAYTLTGVNATFDLVRRWIKTSKTSSSMSNTSKSAEPTWTKASKDSSSFTNTTKT